MKKATSAINTILIITLLFTILFNYACKRATYCDQNGITTQETNILNCYSAGSTAIFKNDSTGILDTLRVTDKEYGTTQSCKVNLNAFFVFSHLMGCHIQINHGQTAQIIYSNYLQIPLNGSLQTMTVNGITYNDMLVDSIKSDTISPYYYSTTPKKFNYSISKGFVRFYMFNKQTWTKL